MLDDWRSGKKRTEAAARRAVVDDLMTLLFAGFETTAATISWLLYELALHSDIQLALRNEVQQRMADDPVRYFAADDTLLAMCVFEALRLHPSLPAVIRQARKEFELGGIRIHPRDYLVLSVEEMHKHYFGAGGDVFQPERFRTKAQYPKMATFGGGTETCPGRAIAVQEARIVCALLLSYFVFRTTMRTDSRIMRNNVSASPRGGMVLSLERGSV